MNCKPGDLAIVIHANRVENIGKIVEVIEWYGEDSNPAKFYDCWVVKGNMIQQEPWTVPIASDSWLRPITGIPMEEETKESIKEPA